MVANPKQALHTLIDQLSDHDAAETLAYARQLLGRTHSSVSRPRTDVPGRPHALPTLHHGSPIDTIDDLRTPIFAPDDGVEEFDATLRRWREEPEGV